MPDTEQTPAFPLSEIDDGQALAGFSRSRIAMVITNPRLEDNPIVYVNEAFERVTGYSRSAALGRNCRFLQGPDTDSAKVQKLRDAIGNCKEVSVEITNYRADGTEFKNQLIVSPIHDGDEDCALFVGLQLARDGRAAEAAEAVDSQLREIQHRVKNHLSMIIGMIRMQSRDSSDPTQFSALARRIESLQLLYEEMSSADETHNRDAIPLGSYLSRISNAVSHIAGRPGVRVNVAVEPLEAPVHTATQLGLILSEVLTNAFQHAFEGRREGLVDVKMAALAQGGLRLSVSDDGVGMPEGKVWPQPGSLGGRLIAGMVDSLGGSLNVARGAAGTVISVDVPRVGETQKE
ncbi:PAS domain-containing protein [Mesobaculum littorinae]|uniref:histidine kinase n=1 Tax=Mesobaculum littorinae TaxID=2486419 RepID=A0A438AIP1_9RHOB|nr:PAS domain-containing protein [Mesobaculum littorinae]RVV98528.1 PAS domain-containing protein [Mesobaculum littorinae]